MSRRQVTVRGEKHWFESSHPDFPLTVTMICLFNQYDEQTTRTLREADVRLTPYEDETSERKLMILP